MPNQQNPILSPGSRKATAPGPVVDYQIAKDLNTEKLKALTGMSSKVLFKTRTYFPMDLFPDEIVISIAKIDIVYNEFLSRKIIPVYFQNISDVFVNNGIFFSTLSIVDLGFVENTVEVKNLLNKDAVEAMKIIQGVVVAVKQGVDLTKVDVEKFLPQIKTIGIPKLA